MPTAYLDWNASAPVRPEAAAAMARALVEAGNPSSVYNAGRAARAMIERLRSLPLLTGYRGRPAADLDQIADALVRLGNLAVSAGSRLRELDVNPLFVAQGRIAAADARATLG